jgi:hypothetical protein
MREIIERTSFEGHGGQDCPLLPPGQFVTGDLHIVTEPNSIMQAFSAENPLLWRNLKMAEVSGTAELLLDAPPPPKPGWLCAVSLKHPVLRNILGKSPHGVLPDVSDKVFEHS